MSINLLDEPVQPEISAPNAECPNPKLWSMYDGMATEVETLHFIYSLVRLTKPKVCVETGTYMGHGTFYIARALAENGNGGIVHTAEPDQTRCLQAIHRLKELGADGDCMVYHMTGVQLINTVVRNYQDLTPIDFAFLDSNLDTRIAEMRELEPWLRKGGIVAVHDTSTYHDTANAGPRTPFLKFAEAHSMQVMNFDTPRGLMLLRKVC